MKRSNWMDIAFYAVFCILGFLVAWVPVAGPVLMGVAMGMVNARLDVKNNRPGERVSGPACLVFMIGILLANAVFMDIHSPLGTLGALAALVSFCLAYVVQKRRLRGSTYREIFFGPSSDFLLHDYKKKVREGRLEEAEETRRRLDQRGVSVQ